jgi:phosphatidyl-myo-inositol dimannoside synthase
VIAEDSARTGRGPIVEARRPRVLFAATDVLNYGGIQRFNRTLIAALQVLEVDLDVLSLNDNSGTRSAPGELHGARITGFGYEKFSFAAGLVRALASRDYDVLLIGHLHFVRMVTLACRLPGIRVPKRRMLIVHGIEAWGSVRGRVRRALAHATHVLSVSDYTRQSILDQAPELGRLQLKVFPNALAETWVRRAAVAARGDGAPALREGGRPFVLSVTRLGSNSRTKGIVTTLEAVATLGDSGLDYVIAGQGDDIGFLRDCARRLGIAARVHFAGAVSDGELSALYRGCLAFVLPSGQEGFGIVYLEAMYFGAPVIAARARGVLDVVEDERTGLLVSFGDVVGLSAAIGRIAADGKLRERLRRAGRSQVTGDGPFTFDAFVARSAQLIGLRAAAPRTANSVAAASAGPVEV